MSSTEKKFVVYRMVGEDGKPLTPEEIGEYVKNSVVKSAEDGGALEEFLYVSTEGGGPDYCHVGNGPLRRDSAALICDAFNTREICDLLPSELLAEREGLKNAVENCNAQLQELHGHVADLCAFSGMRMEGEAPDVWTLAECVRRLLNERDALRSRLEQIANLEGDTRTCFDPQDAEELWDTLQEALSLARGNVPVPLGAAALRARVAELENWKRDAEAVMPPFQEIGKELGIGLGESVHDKILPGIVALKARITELNKETHDLSFEIDELNIERDALKAQVEELEAKA